MPRSDTRWGAVPHTVIQIFRNPLVSSDRMPPTKKKPPTTRRASKTSSVGGSATRDKARAKRIYKELLGQYPHATCALRYKNPYQLLVATILSAQCTDVRVNMVTPALFKKYPDARALGGAEPSDLEELVRSTGFYRNKAKSLKGAGRAITEQHGGQVPDTMESLLTLPGVARKTANVVLGNAFDTNVGVVVDTHVSRLSQRLGLTKQTDPKKIETDLMKLFPQRTWTMLAHLLIFHGRQVCGARQPKCDHCTLANICPKRGVASRPGTTKSKIA